VIECKQKVIIDNYLFCMCPDKQSKYFNFMCYGYLEGNLWKELWEAAKPIPAVEQTPIYDEDLAV
jgi:hypothetical protein